MRVKLGLEVLLEEGLNRIEGSRVAVIANPSSIDSQFRHVVDLLHAHPAVELVSAMGPQHGIRGETQDNMIEWSGFRDPRTGIPVHSLYGEHRKPTPEMLEGVDALVFDLQDVGARYYTFIHTMALAMEACRELDKRFLVLDRPNPINGIALEGPVLDPAFASFVGLHPLPIRHAMTVGEIAGYLNQERGIGCRLEVVRMQGWSREMFFDDTGLPWVMPSPNIPTLDSALVYPGMCLLEGTNVSEGRGTTRPFELSGAPWIDAASMAERLGGLGLPGVRFRPVHFIPTFHKWVDQVVAGVQIHVLDRRVFRTFATGLAILSTYRHHGAGRFFWNDPPYEYEFEKAPIDILCGTNQIRLGIEAGASLGELESRWRDGLSEFSEIRRRCLLY